MIEYGNTRVAAMRSRLLTAAELRRLEQASGAAELLGLLERAADWQAVLRGLGPLAANPATAVEAAAERVHAERLAALPRFYGGSLAGPVEALVLPLDHARLVALLRRRRAGERPEAIGESLVRGALLSVSDLGRIARAPSPADGVLLAARLGVLGRPGADRVVAAIRSGADDARVERLLAQAADQARDALAAGRTRACRRVRALLDDERAIRAAAVAELEAAGAAPASFLERTATAARLEALARAARRDPLGIGVVAGYVAAVELEAMRVRGALARAVVGWSDELLGRLAGAA